MVDAVITLICIYSQKITFHKIHIFVSQLFHATVNGDFQALVEKHKIPWHEKTAGQLFCDNYSKDIVNLLVDECHSVDVTILLKALVFEVINLESCFSVNTSNGIIQSQSLVIATGGLSFPTMGATDFGYKLAQQFGHSIVKQHPGLVPFTFPKKVARVFWRASWY